MTLTDDGERLLPYARRVLAAQDELLDAFGQARPLLVDLNSAGLVTGRRVLHRARELAPGHELMARYESGLAGAAMDLLAGRLDASFGRFAGLDPALRGGLCHQPVRFEPMAIVLPEDHPLASRETVPLAALAGETVYAGAGNPRTTEWTDLARRLFEGRGVRVAPPMPLAVGREEFERVMKRTGNPVLAVVGFAPVRRTVVRPLVDPVPLSSVSLVWRKGLVHPAFDALRAAAAELSAAEGWLVCPADGWIPAIDMDMANVHI